MFLHKRFEPIVESAKKKYARYALLQKTKGYISYETIFSLSSTLISNNAASLAKGQILGLG